MPQPFIVRALLMAGLVVASTIPALAQTEAPARQYQGVFGRITENPNSRQQMDLTVSLYGGYDDNVLADEGGVGNPAFMRSGWLTGLSGDLSYARQLRRVSLGVRGGTYLRYMPAFKKFISVSQASGAIDFSASLSSSTRLHAAQSLAHRPYRHLLFFPGAFLPAETGEAALPDIDFVLSGRQVLASSTVVGLTHTLSRRSSVSLTYGLHLTDSRGRELDHRDQHAGVRYTRNVTKYLSLRLGYGYRHARHSFAARPTRSHDLDIGADYHRALSFSRNTSVSFGTGTSILRSERVEDGSGDQPTRYLMRGAATLNHEIGRSWTAALGYYRGLQFIDGLAEPVLSDSVSARLGGYLGPRVGVFALAGYSRGEMGLRRAAPRYEAYMASAGVRVALNRHVGIYSQYAVYLSEFPEGIRVPLGLSRQIERHGVRAGLTFWAPVLR